jgi:hypothetical protein
MSRQPPGARALMISIMRNFVCYFYCNGWDLNLGISICFGQPNIEIHLPFGFVRVGWERAEYLTQVAERYRHGHSRFLYRVWGIYQSGRAE